ncbi:MAG: hypothetical protein ACREIT_02905 [Tepidisphaeraceae bacterium]
MAIRTRQAVVIAVLATALCADRASAEAVAPAPRSQGVARGLVSRLTLSLRQSHAPRLCPSRQDFPGSTPTTSRALPVQDVPVVHPAESSPFQFRLPPPVL